MAPAWEQKGRPTDDAGGVGATPPSGEHVGAGRRLVVRRRAAGRALRRVARHVECRECIQAVERSGRERREATSR